MPTANQLAGPPAMNKGLTADVLTDVKGAAQLSADAIHTRSDRAALHLVVNRGRKSPVLPLMPTRRFLVVGAQLGVDSIPQVLKARPVHPYRISGCPARSANS